MLYNRLWLGLPGGHRTAKLHAQRNPTLCTQPPWCGVHEYPVLLSPSEPSGWDHYQGSSNQSHLSSTMAGCVQGDHVSLSSKPLYPEPALPKMARSVPGMQVLKACLP